MLWYSYRQNNSGGSFIGPAIVVCIQADSEELANKIAEHVGIYFDGCSTGQDCHCCGDRWNQPYDGTEELEGVDEFLMRRVGRDNVVTGMYIHNNGQHADFVGVPIKFDTDKIKNKLLTLVKS